MNTINIIENESGEIHVFLDGIFELHVDGNRPVYKRLLIIFLRLLQAPDTSRGGWRTRDGCTPAISQKKIAVALHASQSTISRITGWWHNQNWRRLLGQKSPDVNRLTAQEVSEYIWEKYSLNIRAAVVTEWLRQGRLKGEQHDGWQWTVDPADIAAAMGSAKSRNLREFLDTLPDGALDVLSFRERAVLAMHAGVGCAPTTLAVIGKILNVSRERVRQIKDEAIEKLIVPLCVTNP